MYSYEFLQDLPEAANWSRVELVNKGWSRDRKFYIETDQGKKLLLRLADAEFADKKRLEYEAVLMASRLGVNMSQPLAFGSCGNGQYVYTLLTWIEGEPLDEVIEAYSTEEQYSLGVKAGEVLRKLHTLPAPATQEAWEPRMRRKIAAHLARYRESGIKVDGDEHALAYIEANLHLLADRPQFFQHGDYHVGNLILTPTRELGVIDFNRWDYGDPWEEFYKMAMFSREKSIPFCQGQIQGYFGGEPPELFHRVVALYVADVILFSVVWAMPFGEDEVQGMLERAHRILADYSNFTEYVPKWARNW